MKSVLLIAWREYRQYIFSRGFILFLILMPAAAILVGGTLGVAEKTKPVREFVVYDGAGRFGPAIAEELEYRRKQEILFYWDAWLEIAARKEALEDEEIPAPFAPAAATRARAEAFQKSGFAAANATVAPFLREGAKPFEAPKNAFIQLTLPLEVAGASDAREAAELLRPYLLDHKRIPGGSGPLFAAIVIPADFSANEDAPQAEFWSRNHTDNALSNAVQSALTSALRESAARERGLSEGALAAFDEIEAAMSPFRPDRLGEDAELSRSDQFEALLPAILTYLLLTTVFGVSNLLLTNTIEERSNKIVEILLSSVTADQLMIGKLVGIAAVGLTMPTIFAVTGFLVALGLGGGELIGEVFGALASSRLPFMYLFYFFCAYVIFAMIFLAIGAVSNSLQDAQSYLGPVMLLVFLPLPFLMIVFENPNGLVASILTWIPIYTPYAIMLRAASDPPLWEVVGATLLMLVFAAILTRAMGRIFREAILNAAPAKAGDVWRLLRGR